MGFEGFKTTFYHSDLYDKEYRFEDEETAKKPWPLFLTVIRVAGTPVDNSR